MRTGRTGWRAAMAALSILVTGCGGGAQPTPAPITTAALPAATATAAPTAAPATLAPTAALPTAPPGLAGRLLFSRFIEATHTFAGMFSVAADGSGEIAIPMPWTEGVGRWSGRGDQIAVATQIADGRVGTAILDETGKVLRVLEIPDPTLNLVCIVWSPDDARLACESWDDADATLGGIYTVRSSDGGDLKRLTTPPAGLSDFPGDWGTDALIVFKRYAGGEAAGPLFLVPASGGDARPLTSASYDEPGRFSPDGNQVATSSSDAIQVLDMTGAIVSTIEVPQASLFGPAWSPDGAWLVYSLGRSGPFADLHLSKPDGSEVFQVTHTSDNEINVDWGPDPG